MPKISALPAATYAAAADLLVLDQGNVTKRVAFSVLQAAIANIGPPLSVKNYGALGDGVTNDSAAFQDTHDAAPEGSIIYMPKPTVAYLLNTQLNITKGNHWIGDSESESSGIGTFLSSTAAIDVFNINPAVDSKIFQFEGFTISGGTNGFNLVKAGGYINRQSFFKNIIFVGQTNAGIKSVMGMIGCTHERLHFTGAGAYGIWSEDSIDGLDITSWRGIRVAFKTTEGIHLKDASGGQSNAIAFYDTIIEQCQGRGIYANAVQLHLFNVWLEQNGLSAGAPDIYLDAVGAQGAGVRLHGGFMGSSPAIQNNVRVFANADNTSYAEYGTKHSAALDIINGNDKTLTVALFGPSPPPTVSSLARADRLTTTHMSEGALVAASDLSPTINANTGVNFTRGHMRRAVIKGTFSTSAFTAAALTQDFTLFGTAAKMQITQVWVRVTQAFAGTGWATAVVRVGKTVGGQEYLLDGTVMGGTPTYGDADAELGASINRAAAVQGGDYSNGGIVTLRLTTTGGNVSAITAGALEVYLETQLLP